jgi:hypothetical protein
MSKTKKPTIAWSWSMLVMTVGLTQIANAGLLNESGISALAYSNGTGTSPASEELTVNWSVIETAPGIYDYSYTVNNPMDDVIIASGLPEEVDAFSVTFNTATLIGSPAGGVFPSPFVAPTGVEWLLGAIPAGSSSGPYTFVADAPPKWGDAAASDQQAPSPWNSIPNGQPVPVPSPDSASTVALLGGALALLTIGRRRLCSAI